MDKKTENSQNLKHGEQKKTRKTARNVLIGILASMTGFSAVMVTSALIAYDAFVVRYERPDYDLYPGDYCYARVKSRLYREEFYYFAHQSQLKGYYYPAQEGKALVVLAHGFHAGADDYLPMIEFFVNGGYNVFAFDCTGTYDSKGEDMVGMCQALVDLDGTMQYLKSTQPYASQPMMVIGHSWGGYAAASVLELHKDIRACACIAPMNNGYTIMQEKGEQYVGKLSMVSKPIFNAYQKMLFKKYVNYSGVQGINSVSTPVFIAQGVDDKIITYTGQSIMAHRDEITNPNVIYYETVGLQGDHNNIWHSIDSIAYQNKVSSGLKKLEIEKGSKLSKEEKITYYNTVNHTLYSEVNGELMGQILQMFDNALINS